ncbi:uncharacterized protein LOC120181379 [Hibiscus syriacus]|uniref:uncharacterized protein LOC120181379 n=1 Tax=Hibiscus syriacus TaxID=106335 RepID=UPI001920C0FE|nr:uncharacterized protein LOC120181379 [Hibiscus syriacus]
MVKGYGRKNISPRCSMKIDLHKAFDSLDWRFILLFSKLLSFPNSLLLGLKNVSLKSGNLDSVTGVLSVLDQFHQISGLKLNSSKSELFATGIPLSMIDNIKRIYGFKIGSLPVKYLGIPLVSRNLTEKDCEALLTKMKQRLQLWKILAGNGSLWVAWLNNYVLKNQDFWHFQAGATTKEIWEMTQMQKQKVPWHRLIWFPMHVPKHNMIAWMTLLDNFLLEIVS